MKNLAQLFHEANKREGERLGQAMFNALYELDPEAANRIRGTLVDPFHNNANIPNFLSTLATYYNWNWH
jgi:hypothetical protein